MPSRGTAVTHYFTYSWLFPLVYVPVSRGSTTALHVVVSGHNFLRRSACGVSCSSLKCGQWKICATSLQVEQESMWTGPKAATSYQPSAIVSQLPMFSLWPQLNYKNEKMDPSSHPIFASQPVDLWSIFCPQLGIMYETTQTALYKTRRNARATQKALPRPTVITSIRAELHAVVLS